MTRNVRSYHCPKITTPAESAAQDVEVSIVHYESRSGCQNRLGWHAIAVWGDLPRAGRVGGGNNLSAVTEAVPQVRVLLQGPCARQSADKELRMLRSAFLLNAPEEAQPATSYLITSVLFCELSSDSGVGASSVSVGWRIHGLIGLRFHRGFGCADAAWESDKHIR
jgi:hypothetical protein